MYTLSYLFAFDLCVLQSKRRNQQGDDGHHGFLQSQSQAGGVSCRVRELTQAFRATVFFLLCFFLKLLYPKEVTVCKTWRGVWGIWGPRCINSELNILIQIAPTLPTVAPGPAVLLFYLQFPRSLWCILKRHRQNRALCACTQGPQILQVL